MPQLVVYRHWSQLHTPKMCWSSRYRWCRWCFSRSSFRKDANCEVELVNPNQLVRSIRKPNNTIKELTGSLPGLLAAQNKELEALSFDRGYRDNFSTAIYIKLYQNSNKPHCIDRVPDTQRVRSELSQ